tara:strand:+ start:402 stop:623 length:222 start_codon:yes stop_codon:yes gene_type:complete
MEFYEITEEMKATPGEYIYHEPTRQIVLCGSFNRRLNRIRVLAKGKMFADKIKNFKKIKMDRKSASCKGCKGM